MPRIRLARRATRGAVAVAVLTILGAGTMLYPAGASWFSQLEQSQLTLEYSVERSADGVAVEREAIGAARAYNDTLLGGAIGDPQDPDSADGTGEIAKDYRAQLANDANGVMARIRIPSIAVDLPIYHGTTEETLREGIGHLFGSSLPVGGIGTHAVLTGHRGLPESMLFTDLDKVVVGDLVQIDVEGETLTYRIVSSAVFDPTDTEPLLPVAGRDLLTLVTCTPLGINSQRIFVTAERVENPPADDPALVMPDIPGPPWWSVGLASAFLTGASVVTGTARRREPLPPVHGRHVRGRGGQHAAPAVLEPSHIYV
ncbi:class C sortase [Agrococcus terreus]|uniref:class C sortase n=1 Tax=Agrococcus terreus TaxID=574649 RepID=UPI00384E3F96